MSEEKQRTIRQNRSLHKYAELLAQALKEAGYEDMRTVVKVPICPTKENVKEEMIKPVMQAMFPELDSTAKLTTKQMQELYEQMNLFTSERLGVSVVWPSEEPPAWEEFYGRER